MPLQLTMCRLCSRSRPEFVWAVARLIEQFPAELVLEELDCMAACDDVPAVMLDLDYFPQIGPCQLERLVSERLQPLHCVNEAQRS